MTLTGARAESDEVRLHRPTETLGTCAALNKTRKDDPKHHAAAQSGLEIKEENSPAHEIENVPLAYPFRAYRSKP